jgi:hypothetical protein
VIIIKENKKKEKKGKKEKEKRIKNNDEINNLYLNISETIFEYVINK